MPKSAWLTQIPDPIRRREVDMYVADVNRLSQLATAAKLLLHTKILDDEEPETASLGYLLDGIDKISRELCNRQDVVAPASAADTLDVLYDRTYEATHHIYALHALLEVISGRVEDGTDGPLISLVDLSREQLTEIRRAFYGEDMGP